MESLRRQSGRGNRASPRRSRARSHLELDHNRHDVPTPGRGEQIEIVSRSVGQLLGEQGSTPGEKKPRAGRQIEEHVRYLDLELRQPTCCAGRRFTLVSHRPRLRRHYERRADHRLPAGCQKSRTTASA
jgi:hypothetical protein